MAVAIFEIKSLSISTLTQLYELVRDENSIRLDFDILFHQTDETMAKHRMDGLRNGSFLG